MTLPLSDFARTAFVVEFEEAGGRLAASCFTSALEARQFADSVERDGGRVIAKRVEHGNRAASLLRAVACDALSKKAVF